MQQDAAAFAGVYVSEKPPSATKMPARSSQSLSRIDPPDSVELLDFVEREEP